MEGNQNQQKYYYSWNELEEDIKKIAVWASGKSFSGIYGIPRGGLIPAVLLSHQIGIPLVFSKNEINSNMLIIDDMVDTGKTMGIIEKSLGFRPTVVSLFFEESALFVPDFFVRKKELWVVFPWETEASSRYDGTGSS